MSAILTFDEFIYPEIGKRLLQSRKGKFTQEQLAEALLARGVKLKRASIANIEKGNQRVMIHVLYEIAAVLEIEVNKLLPSLKEIRTLSGNQTKETEDVAWAKSLAQQAAQSKEGE